MAAKGRPPAGKALDTRRKVIVAPVFGQSKAVRGFRRFLLRGVKNIRGEWRLVCLGHHWRKLWRSGGTQSLAETTGREPSGFERPLCRASGRGETAYCGAQVMSSKAKKQRYLDIQPTNGVSKSRWY